MKKAYSFVVAIVLAVAMFTVSALPAMAFAADYVDDTTSTNQQTRASVVYPVSGSTSGSIGSSSLASSTARYGNLPAGDYYFDYSFDAQNGGVVHNGTIEIWSGSERVTRTLIGDGGAHSTSSFHLNGGSYTVKVVASTGCYGFVKYYAYTLRLI